MVKRFLVYMLSAVMVFQMAVPSAMAVSYQNVHTQNLNNPIVGAAGKGDYNHVAQLIRQGYSTNSVGYGGATPLMMAAYNNDIKTVKLLLANGANINSLDANGNSVVDYAISKNNFGMADYLHANGANAGAADSSSMWTNALYIIGGVLLVAALIGAASSDDAADSGNNNGVITPPTGNPTPSTSVILPAAPASGAFTIDAEFSAQNALSIINADDAFARGYDGTVYDRNADGTNPVADTNKKIKIAVIDGGIDLTHSELDDQLATTGATCTSSGCSGTAQASSSEDSHGTQVASMALAEDDGAGIMGTAPQAQLIPIRSIGVTDGDTGQAFNYAVAQGAHIINNSWGANDASNNTIPITGNANFGSGATAVTPAQVETYFNYENSQNGITNGINNNVIFAFATGNTGGSQPSVYAGLPYYYNGQANNGINASGIDLRSNWVAVAAYDTSTGEIAGFSERCGVAADWCLVAPGVNITGANNGGGQSAGDGTSFATPLVSGAIASVMGAFTHLTPEQALRIILESATDLGAAGIDDIYGHGLLNMNAATTPSGQFNVPTGSNVISGKFALSNSYVSAPSSFSLSGLGNKNFLVLDEYTRYTTSNLNNVVKLNSSALNIDEHYSNFNDNRINMVSVNEDLSFGITQQGYERNVVERDEGRDVASFAISYKTSANSTLKISNNISADEALGITTHSNSMLDDSSLMSFADDGYSSSMQYNLDDGSIKLGIFEGSDEYNIDNNMRGITFDGSYNISDNLGATIQLAMIEEDSTILGGAFSGAFSAEGATSYIATAKIDYQPIEGLEISAFASMGTSSADAASNSLITGFSDIKSSSYGISASYGNGFVSISQPMRVNSASINYNLPDSVNSDGSINYSSGTSDISASGHEVDIELGYATQIGEKSNIRFGTLTRFNPEHNNDNDTEFVGFVKYQTNF